MPVGERATGQIENDNLGETENQIWKIVDLTIRFSGSAPTKPTKGISAQCAGNLERAAGKFLNHVEDVGDRQGNVRSMIAVLACGVVEPKEDFVVDAMRGFEPGLDFPDGIAVAEVA